MNRLAPDELSEMEIENKIRDLLIELSRKAQQKCEH